MSVLIQNKKVANKDQKIDIYSLPPEALRILPKHIIPELENLLRQGKRIEEIRLRSHNASSVTSDKENIILHTPVSSKDIEGLVIEACDGSPYAYGETIRRGYITLSNGIRIGVCGRAAVERNRIIGIRDISGINVRIPSYSSLLGACVADKLFEMKKEGKGGMLIYSPPGEGKTTLLRSLTVHMSSGKNALRVVVVDTRDELSVLPPYGSLCVDVLSGYPKAEGIEIATRTMNAELIICDEIGGKEDVEAILVAQNCGVPLLASAHAGNISGLLKRSEMQKLHRSEAFDMYVGIRRPPSGGEYEYTFTSWEKANDSLAD